MQKEDLRAKLAGQFGGNMEKAPKYNLPIIRLNGTDGKYTMTTYTDGESKQEELGEVIEYTIIKNRKKLEDYNNGLSTSEYSQNGVITTLFLNSDGKYSKEAVGTAADLRKKYTTLKTHEILYVIYEGEVCRLIVKGSSSSKYYEFLEQHKEDGTHLYEYKTISEVESAPNPKKRNSKYYFMSFKKGKESDLEKVSEKMDEVDAELKKIDDYNTKQVSGQAVKPMNENKIDDFVKDDEITDKDIPFD